MQCEFYEPQHEGDSVDIPLLRQPVRVPSVRGIAKTMYAKVVLDVHFALSLLTLLTWDESSFSYGEIERYWAHKRYILTAGKR